MGLGPPVCQKCKLLGWYTPNDNPYKQGKYLCRMCGEECLDNLWFHPKQIQDIIERDSNLYEEILRWSFPDK